MQTTTRNVPGGQRGGQPRKPYNPGRDGGKPGTGPSAHGNAATAPRLDDILRSRIPLKLPKDFNGNPLRVSRRNYREIFTSVRAYAQTVGREIPFELEAGDPAVLGNILNYLQNTTGNEVFFLEEDGTSSFWLAESLLTFESLAVPLAPTY